MANLKKVEVLSAREQVASILRKSILGGDFHQGELITLDSVGEQVGVSRTPVREAFQMLADEGLIELRRNRCAMVKGITPKMIRDHYEMRMLLEGEAVYRVCVQREDLSGIEAVYAQAADACRRHDVEAYNLSNQAFHMSIWKKAGNEKLQHFLSQLWNGMSMAKTVAGKEYACLSLGEHSRVMTQLRLYDAEAARSAMKLHIERSMNDMLMNFNGI